MGDVMQFDEPSTRYCTGTHGTVEQTFYCLFSYDVNQVHTGLKKSTIIYFFNPVHVLDLRHN